MQERIAGVSARRDVTPRPRHDQPPPPHAPAKRGWPASRQPRTNAATATRRGPPCAARKKKAKKQRMKRGGAGGGGCVGQREGEGRRSETSRAKGAEGLRRADRLVAPRRVRAATRGGGGVATATAAGAATSSDEGDRSGAPDAAHGRERRRRGRHGGATHADAVRRVRCRGRRRMPAVHTAPARAPHASAPPCTRVPQTVGGYMYTCTVCTLRTHPSRARPPRRDTDPGCCKMTS